jgi:hypothetical protein
MRGKKVFAMFAVAALGALGITSAVARDDVDKREERGGFVVPCSLAGVNPVHHPEIFGNPAAARAYGFVRSRNGAWQVQDDCFRGRRY